MSSSRSVEGPSGLVRVSDSNKTVENLRLALRIIADNAAAAKEDDDAVLSSLDVVNNVGSMDSPNAIRPGSSVSSEVNDLEEREAEADISNASCSSSGLDDNRTATAASTSESDDGVTRDSFVELLDVAESLSIA